MEATGVHPCQMLQPEVRPIVSSTVKGVRAVTGFLARFSGRPQQLGFFFNQKNMGNVSDPFGLISYLVVVDVAEADSICKVTSVAGGVAGRKIGVCLSVFAGASGIEATRTNPQRSKQALNIRCFLGLQRHRMLAKSLRKSGHSYWLGSC